ncbi:cytidylyltransferase domain-containing protein [Flavobacterium sp. TMP13]|uniref:cytidylyltransferase domain-containing protein n=1 Tax=Flavobacterium sp. TMP13 TaxID=3425950 RepID=UPI003D7817E2
MVDGLQNKKIAFIIQARMQSTRLPGKILLPMPIGSDFCLLDQIIISLKSSKRDASIYIATSENVENDVLEKIAIVNEVNYFRGSENDVLSRFISIIEQNFIDVVVRLTADNPVVDVSLLDETIDFHIKNKKEYTNTVGLPLGMNFEVIDANALLSLKNKNLTSQDKEHVTLYIKNSSEFTCESFKIGLQDKYNNVRVTIDYPSDYLVVSSLFSLYSITKIPLGLRMIEYVVDRFPFLFECNQSNIQKDSCKTLEEEIDFAIPILEKLELTRLVNVFKSKIHEGI